MADAAHVGGDSSQIQNVPLFQSQPDEHGDSEHPYEIAPHNSLSPYSMGLQTLSRPASMTSMGNFSLPQTTNSLSRGPSLSNILLHHNSNMNGLYFTNQVPYFAPYPGQQQQQSNDRSPQQQQQPSHMSHPSNFASQVLGNNFMSAGLDYGLPPNGVGRKNDYIIDDKPVKKQKTKKNASGSQSKKGDGDDSEPVSKPRSKNPSSIYRGVSKCSKDGRWQARIRVKRQVTYLGRFVNEEDAARKYDEAAREHHGEKAVLNFPTPEDKQLGRKQATGAVGPGGNDSE